MEKSKSVWTGNSVIRHQHPANCVCTAAPCAPNLGSLAPSYLAVDLICVCVRVLWAGTAEALVMRSDKVFHDLYL